MVEPLWPDWRETWFRDSDVEWGENDMISYHIVRRLDDDEIVRFEISQQVRKPPDGQPWPVHRETFDDGKIVLEEFGNRTRAPLNTEEREVEIKDATIAFSEVKNDIWKKKEERKAEWEQ